ncbi:hypothetical protein POJ06DRAFT_263070 [Lipomyces tetrasporus]|uniref:Uncharacterized protein n=1 Tax=Lipomyces tetrasporus TaxID=54092 RepID=A0AAD7QKC7_9ASCO|nr:uncharacterized protein POJ06DRAFT_263070 [Lipomyces tetrasporus]KAJ8096659.1 hypothetical protein POJ06DRAFT_263070 [Lipomyces tetrasporus]
MIPPSLTFFPLNLIAPTVWTWKLMCSGGSCLPCAPVNVILQSIYPQFNIGCKSEVRWLRGDGYSRLDMNWQCNGVIFAVLEFKRPYSIRYSEWRKPMTGAGQVTGIGQRIARQLKKYGYYARTPYFGVSDWFTLMHFNTWRSHDGMEKADGRHSAV